jgi:oleate hydratase
MAQNRDPKETQAWLIGGGIASLAAAVHLIQNAKVPAPQIHILDVHKASGGAMEEVSGNLEDGYVLHTGAQVYFHEQCVEELLKMVPSQHDPEKSVLQSIKDHELQNPTNEARTRALRLDEEGRLKAKAHRMHIGIKLRMALVAFILDHERASDSRQIKEAFEDSFFQTDFWALWSTT